MANEAGNPDLIYRFLALSGHHSLWHTRGGAGFGLEALLQSRARSEVLPILSKLIPRLFRYRYDPSQRVREGVGRLWSTLVRDPAAAVAKHLDGILAELVKTIASDQWREREAACLGLNDALTGRSGGDVVPHIEGLWRACMHAIDDVKDSVREAALLLLKVRRDYG